MSSNTMVIDNMLSETLIKLSPYWVRAFATFSIILLLLPVLIFATSVFTLIVPVC